MRLLHGSEMHFERCSNGRVYSTSVATYSWWQKYLQVFDEVLVVARVRSAKEIYPPERLAEGPGVVFHDLPDFRGPEQYLWHARAVRKRLLDALSQTHACIFSVPGTIGYLGAQAAILQRRDFAFEVVGDPYEVFARGSVQHPLRFYFRHWHTKNLRHLCHAAFAVSYVTEHTLQRRYPPAPEAFVSHYSDVILQPEHFLSCCRNLSPDKSTCKLILVGSLQQLYKGPDVLIKAVAMVRRRGVDIALTIAGDGRYRPLLEALAHTEGVADVVRFVGYIANRARLTALLDDADLFVLPSLTEGLPRAMLEAMARGLPCLGSNVGGIPELLDPEDLVPPRDSQALADRIYDVATDTGRRERMSRHNLAKAREFEADAMRKPMLEFLSFVRERTENPQPNARRTMTLPV